MRNFRGTAAGRHPVREGIEFRYIPGYPTHYCAGSDGTIWSCRSGEWKRLSGTVKRSGADRKSVYLAVCISGHEGGPKSVLVHRLVLMAFRGEPEFGHGSRHLNGDPFDNRIENLEWGSQYENMQDRKRHGNYARGAEVPASKLSDEQVEAILEKYRSGQATLREIAKEHNVSWCTIQRVCSGKSWQHVSGGPAIVRIHSTPELVERARLRSEQRRCRKRGLGRKWKYGTIHRVVAARKQDVIRCLVEWDSISGRPSIFRYEDLRQIHLETSR